MKKIPNRKEIVKKCFFDATRIAIAMFLIFFAGLIIFFYVVVQLLLGPLEWVSIKYFCFLPAVIIASVAFFSFFFSWLDYEKCKIERTIAREVRIVSIEAKELLKDVSNIAMKKNALSLFKIRHTPWYKRR